MTTRVERVAPAIAVAAAFGLYLVAAAVFATFPNHYLADTVLLVAIAATTSWWAGIRGALGIAVLGWLFYAGFVTHTEGQLGVTGPGDLVVLGVLVGIAMTLAAVRVLFAYPSPRSVPRADRNRPLVTPRYGRGR
jgi:hypothetical protein